MSLENKTIAVAVAEGFEDLEFWAVVMRLQEEGAQVLITGSKPGQVYKSKSGGLEARSEYDFSDLKPGVLDALVIPGGWAPDKLRRDERLLELVREMDRQKKVLAFICHGGWVAASAGILQGRRVTGSLGVKDDLKNAGGVWVDEPAFDQEHLVWGRVVADIPEFNRILVKTLQGT